MGMMRWLCRCLHAAPPKHEGACMKKCENWAIEELAPALCYFWWRSFVFLQSCNTNWGNAESVFPLWDDFTTLHLKTERIFLNTNRRELLQMLTINYNPTYDSVVKRPIGPKKAMPALKGSTFTALASERTRAGSHSIWQRKRLPNIKNRQQETRAAHLPENWCKLLMSDTAHGLPTQCTGYQCSQHAASHMVKGKNHYKPRLSLPSYLRHEHALPAVRDREAPAQREVPRQAPSTNCRGRARTVTRRRPRLLAGMATAPLSPAPKSQASRHVMGATVTQQLLQQDVSSCSRKKGRAKNTSEKVQTQTPTNGAKSSKRCVKWPEKIQEDMKPS